MPNAPSSPGVILRPVAGSAAEAVSKQFVEVLMAPDFTAEALAIFQPKVNVRLMKIALPAGGATDVIGRVVAQKLALVLGAEGEGLRDGVRKNCDACVALPTRCSSTPLSSPSCTT